MKKNFKRRVPFDASHSSQDIGGLLFKINQRLEFLEKKIDALAHHGSGSDLAPHDRAPAAEQYVQDRRTLRHDDDGAFPEKRVFTKVRCSGCGNECEVPFKPIGDRPVYCRTCFAKQKENFPAKEKYDKRDKPGFFHKKKRY